MKNLIFIFIFFFIFSSSSFSVKLIGENIICNGKYQSIGYEFLTENKVVRHASSLSESDYYKDPGFYIISDESIKLDVEGDIFSREISRETLELSIGVHSNNSIVGKCKFYEGDLSTYFKKLHKK